MDLESMVNVKKGSNLGRGRARRSCMKISIYIFCASVICYTLLCTFSGGVMGTNKVFDTVFRGSKSGTLSDQYSNTVILVSVDGLRAEYLSRGLTDNINELSHTGIKVDYMVPSFPSTTFANHYTIVTGLYPESHGIVGNKFYDPSSDDEFDYKSKSSWKSKWWGGEPIWVTAEMQSRKSAIYMWPGSTSVIKGTVPTYMIPFKDNVHPNKKMDQVVDWLLLPIDKRPKFLATYIPEVDQMGHSFGPDSKQVNQSLKLVDQSIKHLVTKLKKLDIYQNVNIVVVSDHGMTASNVPSNVYYIEDIINSSFKNALGSQICKVYLWPLAGILPCSGGDVDEIYKKLKIAEIPGVWSVYKRNDVPAKYNYSKNDRIPPIVIITEPPYIMEARNKKVMEFDGFSSFFDIVNISADQTIGTHGYTNFHPDMYAVFVAHGPAFQHGKPNIQKSHESIKRKTLDRIHELNKKEQFYNQLQKSTGFDTKHEKQTFIKNVDVYGILARILNVEPAPNNGTMSIVEALVTK
ncbi:hypothetical protein BB559_000890 [Furculomyces boomerangus]|uniref:Uncharacterized protein n=1 Tax=Furculomyces boomerangus TaxID=61424 RepID=A0A2T9Z3Q3_9FUNG|nr:hypothetical protein BB559_000890 [Furculomyces boomerangus]